MSNFSKDIKEEVEDIKKKVKKIGNDKQSLAYEMLLQQKKEKKMQLICFTIIMSLLIIYSAIITGYLIYVLNDTTVVETTEEYKQDIKDNGDINNTNIVNGGDING